MELPKHTCISCAYLFQFDENRIPFTISADQREKALDGTRWNSRGINYERLVCYEDKRNYLDLNKRNQVIDIRNGVINPFNCKSWAKFRGISPNETKQRELGKWGKLAFWVAVATLCIVIITWVLTQFVLD